MLPNPYILLGLAVFWAVSVGGAYFKGSQHAQDAARAQYATDLESAIAESRENAVIDMQAAREAGERDARARTRTVTVTNEVERVIHAQPAPAVCRLNPDAFRLLGAAVEIANGADTDPAKPMPDAGPKTRPAGKPGAGRDHALSVSSDSAIR